MTSSGLLSIRTTQQSCFPPPTRVSLLLALFPPCCIFRFFPSLALLFILKFCFFLSLLLSWCHDSFLPQVCNFLPFTLSSFIHPLSILPSLPSLHCSFTLSTLVVPIMQMSVCGGPLKSRLGPGSLLIVTWLFHRGQQEGGISTYVCVHACV